MQAPTPTPTQPHNTHKCLFKLPEFLDYTVNCVLVSLGAIQSFRVQCADKPQVVAVLNGKKGGCDTQSKYVTLLQLWSG